MYINLCVYETIIQERDVDLSAGARLRESSLRSCFVFGSSLWSVNRFAFWLPRVPRCFKVFINFFFFTTVAVKRERKRGNQIQPEGSRRRMSQNCFAMKN